MFFVKFNVVCLLRRYYCPLAYTLVKYHSASLSAPSVTSSFPSTLTTTRSLSVGWPLRTDTTQRQNTETRQELDLDIWKSVMKSQALQEEKPKDEENSSANEVELSPLEANRQLVEMWHLAGKVVPEQITDEQLEKLAEFTTKSSKKKYLKYLAIKEGHKKANKEKKDKKMAERKEKMENEDGDSEGKDGEFKLRNTYLMKFWTRSMDTVLGWRAAQAMQYGQPLIFDMSYDQHMSQRELENTVSQLLETEGWNRRAADPFHLHFCNLQPDGAYHRELLKRYGRETWERLFLTDTSRRHVDVFPHESLVYLTADSPNVLHTFDHSKVYIVGAMVDRSIQSGVSLANAKRLRLASARLPLNEFLHWDCGAKNLTLDQMIRILLTVKETGSWEKALEFVPKRKHDGFHQDKMKKRHERTPPVSNRRSFPTSTEPGREKAQIFVSQQRPKNLKGSGVDWKPSSESDHTTGQTRLRSESDHTTSGQTRLRSALKSKMEERKMTMSRTNWEE